MKSKNMFFVFISLFCMNIFASERYHPLIGEDSAQSAGKSGCCSADCCSVGMKDSKTHQKRSVFLGISSCVGTADSAALSFGAAYSISPVVCIGLSSAAGCAGCFACVALALAARECTLAQITEKQEYLRSQKPVNAFPVQHIMNQNGPSNEKDLMR